MWQTDAIRDHVFPVAKALSRRDERFDIGLLGTGFVIGSRGWALTASHVLSGTSTAYALFARDRWQAIPIVEVIEHPSEDVSLMRLHGDDWHSIFDLDVVDVRSSFECCIWGYPADVLHEVVTAGVAVPRPDLAFTAGFVRRVISDIQLPRIRGSQLAELVPAAGSGCSGAPMLGWAGGKSWSVAGVYIGERSSDHVQVGYAALTEAFAEWTPVALGRSVRAEAASSIVGGH